MKNIYVAGAVVLLASQFLGRAYAVELCEPGDYNSLADSSKSSIKTNKANDKNDPQQLVFELLKNYPFEQKDKFSALLLRKIELIDSYISKHQGKRPTEKINATISLLVQAKQDLSNQLDLVNAAIQDNWVSIRDQAGKVLEEAARKLREVQL